MAEHDPTPIEEWRAIAGFPGYQVSSLGRVRSRSKVLRQTPHRPGSPYLRVSLHDAGQEIAMVHKLVLEAFAGPRPPGFHASHLNGNASDNRAANLVWESERDNHARKEAHGTVMHGVKNGKALLTREDVRAIFTVYRARDPVLGTDALAARYSVSRDTIRLILHRRRYARETADLPAPKLIRKGINARSRRPRP